MSPMIEKSAYSAGAGLLYAAGAVAGTAACLGAYYLAGKINSLIDNYIPSFKGTLNAGVVITTSTMGAYPLNKYLVNKEYNQNAAKIVGALIIFLATATLTPKVSSLLSTYKVSYRGASLYGLFGAASFSFLAEPPKSRSHIRRPMYPPKH